MVRIAKGVWYLPSFPRYLINTYLVEDVLIDAGTRFDTGKILSQLRERRPRLVALTHCHPDHQGAARAVCERFHVPLACHPADKPAMEGRAPMVPQNRLLRISLRTFAGPTYPVEQELREGDEVAGFRVVSAPGHTPGHVIFFRDLDRVAIAGDVLANIHFITLRPGLREPPPFFSDNYRQNRLSILRLAELRPSLVCFGHGPPLRRPELLDAFIDARRWRSLGPDSTASA